MQTKTKTLQLAPGVDLEIIRIPAGNFMMGSAQNDPNRLGSEGPPHEVTLEDFYISKCLITQAQWQAVASMPKIKWELNPNPTSFNDFPVTGDRHPIESVSWFDAMEFCARLSVYSSQTYTLPSEAQWEYACRAGTTTPYYFGDKINCFNEVNYLCDSTFPVAAFPPNAYGLHDMHGSVWEWCLDHYHDSYKGAPTDGTAWESKGNCRFRILRGGSWNSNPRDCRSTHREYQAPNCTLSYIGFRVVNVPPETVG